MKKKTILFTAAILATASFNTFAQITNPAPYCDGTFDDDPFNVPDHIKAVSLGTLNNVSDDQAAFPHYIFYNNLSAPVLEQGSTHELKVTFQVNGGAGYGVWIDFNGDNAFSTTERVAGTDGMTESLDITNNTVITKTITIPANAKPGKTRMRVRIVEDDNYTMTHGYYILPCNLDATPEGIMDWGETEDYEVEIKATTPSSIENIKQGNNFSLYPNPAKSSITIQSNTENKNAYQLFNITGQQLAEGTFESTEKNINIENLSHGVYYIQLFHNGVSLGTQKFVK